MAAKLLGPAKTCRATHDTASDRSHEDDDDWQSVLRELTGVDTPRCPHCGEMTVERAPMPEPRAPPLVEAA